MWKLKIIKANARRLHDDEGGVTFIWFALLFTVIIALIGLALDVVAAMNLHSSQQEVADAAALAGARELDGTTGALTRARTAATTSLANTVSWSNDGSSSGSLCSGTPCPIDTVNFYMTLADLKSGTVTTSDKAAYIKVTTKRRSVIANFIRLVSRQSSVTATASAAANSRFVTCAPLQSYMCNPYETSGSKGDAATFLASGSVNIGDQFVLLQGSGSNPGNWGLIQPPGTSGNSRAVHSPFWSTQGTSSCTAYAPGQYVLQTAPGNSARAAVEGMNVRFDRMTNISGVDLTSAPIVISGYKVNGGTSGTSCSRTTSTWPSNSAPPQTNLCTEAAPSAKLTRCTTDTPGDYNNYIAKCNTSSGSCPLPRDRRFTQLGTSTGWGSMLKGTGAIGADLDAYWNNHHNGTRPSSLNTRYKIYEKEVDGTYPFKTPEREPAAPVCTSGLPAATTVDRRLINVAIVDCNYWGLSGRSDLPTTTVTLKMFMTEPATSEGEIYAELVGLSKANESGGPVHQIVTLVQ